MSGKITDLELVKLEITGFRGYNDDQTITVLFGPNKTIIEGENRVGKSALKEAVCYTLFGISSMGDSKDNKYLINLNSEKTVLNLTIRVNGEQHLITKRCAKSKSLKFDGNTVTQQYIEELIDKTAFLIQFNPEYFFKLQPEEQRNYFMSLLPDIPVEDVKQKLSKKVQNILDDINKDINVGDYVHVLEQLRKKKKELEESKIYNKGRRDGLNLDIEIPDEVVFDETELTELRMQVQKLSNSKIDTASYQEKQMQLLKELETIKQLYKPKDLSVYEKTKKTLRETYMAKKELLKQVNVKEGDECSECGQLIPKIAVQKLINRAQEINKPLLKEMHKLVQEGNKINEEIARINIENSEKARKLDEETSRIVNEISGLEPKLNPEKNNQIDKQIEILQKKIDELELQKSNALETNSKRSTLISTLENNKKEYDRLSKVLQELDEEVREIDDKIFSVKEYIKMRSKLMTEVLQKHLKSIKFTLERFTNDGTVHPCFEILYDDKPEKCWCMSDITRAGLEIGDMVRKLTGTSYPTFIDNANNITHYETTAKQVIEAYPKKGAPLLVDGKRPVVTSTTSKKSAQLNIQQLDIINMFQQPAAS